uniref:Methyltransferase type 12 n=1 Tax=Desulfovibrio desulfuricans (strain ATCC 27774 / DSM 6949 / MB) TaxID=525146 RepID=B8J3T0_DESDA
MIRFYQTEWFGIPFDSFASLSFFSLADKAFYEKFYDAFFNKFAGYDALPEPWQAIKRQCAQAIAAHIPPVAAPKILSVGCGSGFVEHCLLQMRPNIQMHCNDSSDSPLRWIAQSLPEEQLHIGLVPECLPQGATFDVIYCNAFEYCLSNKTLVKLLSSLKSWLAPGGRLILISASILDPADSPHTVRQYVDYLHDTCCNLLAHLRGAKPQQFWGWARTRKELEDLILRCGYTMDGQQQIAQLASSWLFCTKC